MTERTNINQKLEVMATQLPGVMNSFSEFHSEVVKDGALTARTKELIMIGMSIVLHCENCISKHVAEAVRLGATREEILEVVGTAVLMAGGPALAYGSIFVLNTLDELNV